MNKKLYNINLIMILLLSLLTTTMTASAESATLTIGDFTTQSGDIITTQLKLNNIQNFWRAIVDVSYDPHVLVLERAYNNRQCVVTENDITTNKPCSDVSGMDGQLVTRIYVNSQPSYYVDGVQKHTPYNGDIILENLEFRVIGDPGTSSKINLKIVEIDTTTEPYTATTSTQAINGYVSVKKTGFETINWYNNFTNDKSLNITVPSDTTVSFAMTSNYRIGMWNNNWGGVKFINCPGPLKDEDRTLTCVYKFVTGNYKILMWAGNTTYGYDAKVWNVTALQSPTQPNPPDDKPPNILPNTSMPTQPNMVPNPGFENDTDKNLLPDKWNTNIYGGSSSKIKFQWATDYKHNGSRSVKIVSNDTYGKARWMTGANIPVVPGRGYITSMYINTISAGSALMCETFWRRDLTQSSGSCSGLGGTRKELLQTITVVPDDAVYARIELRLIGKGTVWFDDITFRRIN